MRGGTTRQQQTPKDRRLLCVHYFFFSEELKSTIIPRLSHGAGDIELNPKTHGTVQYASRYSQKHQISKMPFLQWGDRHENIQPRPRQQAMDVEQQLMVISHAVQKIKSKCRNATIIPKASTKANQLTRLTPTAQYPSSYQ